ncbi:MAG: 4-(cytidine 5'-diphospho)-2-C-methyl-D-erythritol kinase [Ruminococcus sp.]|nr:4-(cytidine 5'-diphospho)-2-C-methyl-D-erythritol kinase [Ruminococcus sp.]
MKIRAAAKINLGLDVTGRLQDGYHLIESVFQSVGLFDLIEAELTEGGIALECTVPEEFAAADPIPCDRRNIAYKAAELYFSETGIGKGCRLSVTKGIPSQAGMGGGSADAAGVLYCLNELCGAPVSHEELCRIGKKLGADVPFCLTGGTAYVGGIGEEIRPLPEYSGRILVIGKGREGVSTGEAYRNIDVLVSPVHPEVEKLRQALETDPDSAPQYFGNLFEQAVCLEEVDSLKSVMLDKGAVRAIMTGSGSAVFGLFRSRDEAEACCEELKKMGYFSAVCETVGKAFYEEQKRDC